MKSSRTDWIAAVINRRTARRTLALGAVSAAVMVMASMPATRAQARTGLTDADITSAIETNLLISDQVPAQNIDVRAKDGIVTLSGSVYNILARDKATEIAESIKGVRSVVNEIVVKPVFRSDEDIRRDVQDALLTDPATDSQKIDVNVSGGDVTLSGQVDSYGERNLCREVAKGVRGVRKVMDQIRVEYKSTRPDEQIAEEIEGLLRDDVRIDAQGIDVHVQDGSVDLTGDVRSAAERSLAETKAWVGGVRSVKDNLKVDWLAPDSMQRKSAYVSRTDRQVEQAVHDALQQDPRVSSFNVAADSDYGVVTLTGKVDNLEAREAAAQDAKDTVGAWRIRNHVKVRPATQVKDEELISRVSAALKRDPYLDRHDIRVSAYNGRVYLYGTVDSEFEKLEAKNVAFRVKGVVDVADYLDVPTSTPWRSDLEIKESVKDQLYWDPVVDSTKLDVSVQNGVATLTGDVGDWYEYSQAAQDAFRGGATGLNNEIHIDHAPKL